MDKFVELLSVLLYWFCFVLGLGSLGLILIISIRWLREKLEDILFGNSPMFVKNEECPDWDGVTHVYSPGFLAMTSGVKGKKNPCTNCPLDDCPFGEVERADIAYSGICDHQEEMVAAWEWETGEKMDKENAETWADMDRQSRD